MRATRRRRPQARPLYEIPDYSIDWPADRISLAGVLVVLCWFWIGLEILPWL